MTPSQRVEAGELLFPARIQRAQVNALPFQRGDAASSQNVDCEIQRQRSRMKQVERPEVHGSSCHVGTAWSLRNDGGRARRSSQFPHAVFVP